MSATPMYVARFFTSGLRFHILSGLRFRVRCSGPPLMTTMLVSSRTSFNFSWLAERESEALPVIPRASELWDGLTSVTGVPFPILECLSSSVRHRPRRQSCRLSDPGLMMACSHVRSIPVYLSSVAVLHTLGPRSQVEGITVLRFAVCYGFRNLQNVVRKIKLGKSHYHFLEIMACPSGCLNGGGQIKPKPGQSVKDLIKHLENVYVEDVLVTTDPFKNPIAEGLYDEWLEQLGSEKAKQYLHTEYRPVVKSIMSQLRNW